MSSAPMTQPAYFDAADCQLDDFKKLISRSLQRNEVPLASSIEKNIPLYDMSVLSGKLQHPSERKELLAEWASVLLSHSGAIVLRNAYAETHSIDAATEVYLSIIQQEKDKAGGGADHFAEAGKNDRIWNSLQKLAEESPETYIDYFSNANDCSGQSGVSRWRSSKSPPRLSSGISNVGYFSILSCACSRSVASTDIARCHRSL